MMDKISDFPNSPTKTLEQTKREKDIADAERSISMAFEEHEIWMAERFIIDAKQRGLAIDLSQKRIVDALLARIYKIIEKQKGDKATFYLSALRGFRFDDDTPENKFFKIKGFCEKYNILLSDNDHRLSDYFNDYFIKTAENLWEKYDKPHNHKDKDNPKYASWVNIQRDFIEMKECLQLKKIIDLDFDNIVFSAKMQRIIDSEAVDLGLRMKMAYLCFQNQINFNIDKIKNAVAAEFSNILQRGNISFFAITGSANNFGDLRFLAKKLGSIMNFNDGPFHEAIQEEFNLSVKLVDVQQIKQLKELSQQFGLSLDVSEEAKLSEYVESAAIELIESIPVARSKEENDEMMEMTEIDDTEEYDIDDGIHNRRYGGPRTLDFSEVIRKRINGLLDFLFVHKDIIKDKKEKIRLALADLVMNFMNNEEFFVNEKNFDNLLDFLNYSMDAQGRDDVFDFRLVPGFEAYCQQKFNSFIAEPDLFAFIETSSFSFKTFQKVKDNFSWDLKEEELDNEKIKDFIIKSLTFDTKRKESAIEPQADDSRGGSELKKCWLLVLLIKKER